jgi:hypothetical protein
MKASLVAAVLLPLAYNTPSLYRSGHHHRRRRGRCEPIVGALVAVAAAGFAGLSPTTAVAPMEAAPGAAPDVDPTGLANNAAEASDGSSSDKVGATEPGGPEAAGEEAATPGETTTATATATTTTTTTHLTAGEGIAHGDIAAADAAAAVDDDDDDDVHATGRCRIAAEPCDGSHEGAGAAGVGRAPERRAAAAAHATAAERAATSNPSDKKIEPGVDGNDNDPAGLRIEEETMVAHESGAAAAHGGAGGPGAQVSATTDTTTPKAADGIADPVPAHVREPDEAEPPHGSRQRPIGTSPMVPLRDEPP